MTDLRKKLVRLAHANPTLRPHILPLVTADGGYKTRGMGKFLSAMRSSNPSAER